MKLKSKTKPRKSISKEAENTEQRMFYDGTKITVIHNLSEKKNIRSIFSMKLLRGNHFFFLSKTSVPIYRQSQTLKIKVKLIIK